MRPKFLMIVPLNNQSYATIVQYCRRIVCELTIEETIEDGLLSARRKEFDALLIDTKVCTSGVIQAIRSLKAILPEAKIIVSTENTSRSLEAVIRREGIFFYHINSFDVRELQLAVKSAIDCKKIYQSH